MFWPRIWLVCTLICGVVWKQISHGVSLIKRKNLENDENQLKTSETSMNIVKTKEKTIKEIEGFQLQIVANSKEKWPAIWTNKKKREIVKVFFFKEIHENHIKVMKTM